MLDEQGTSMDRSRSRETTDKLDELTDRVVAAVTSAIPEGTSEFLAAFSDCVGLVGVGTPALTSLRRIRASGSTTFTLFDPATYLDHTASPERPFQLDESEGLFAARDLTGYVEDIRQDVDVLMSPTGLIAVGDTATVRATLDRCSEVGDRSFVANLPLPSEWFVGEPRRQLLEHLASAQLPVALTLISQLDDPVQQIRVETQLAHRRSG